MKAQRQITSKNSYALHDLEEFKTIILNKLEGVEHELIYLQEQLDHRFENSCRETDNNYMEEDSDDLVSKEELSTLAYRQKKFKLQLMNALFRIENKTYGRCEVTGKLIPKERLKIVPHTTHSIEAKTRYSQLIEK
jgi:DnaK suppressor protein